jgi:uncharacterized protein (DUF736 family)
MSGLPLPRLSSPLRKEATSLKRNWNKFRNSDREYLSVKLDDPSFAAPVYASLVRIEG